ncbi:kinesin-like protein KIN-10C [Zingiber officinale]|uniref:kinesin-like protein KIN-10C n=1 Tax=Zingiber officinale TaxID=94328 RepID=UPI001C4AC3C0|nr:kinesin-like protein KIN-10C [Zingiber officinale]
MDSPLAAGGSSMVVSKPRNQLRRGVRVVGKIRPFLDSEITGSSQIYLNRFSGEYASVTFNDQSNSRTTYKLDWCYDQGESIYDVYNGEVKHLVQWLFCGRNACVIAYGARGSGKSQLIQGNEENLGLAIIALDEILAFANENKGSVSVSCYEMSQDHIYDLLEPKEHEVLILEDAAKRIQLKGLSKVPVNSISDFKKIYFHGYHAGKVCQMPDNSILKNHRGLIVYLSFVDKESNNSLVGKINFVTLADYEDTKPKGHVKPQLAENAKISKSLFALINTVHALNAGENFIPYRESKLTRLLQDFLGITSMAVLFTCLNPVLCQDTVSTINLASRSCQIVNQQRYHSAKVLKSVSRLNQSVMPSSVGKCKLSGLAKKIEFSKCASTGKEYASPSMSKRRQEKLGSSPKTTRASSFCSNEKENEFSADVKERELLSRASYLNKNEIMKGIYDFVNPSYEEHTKPKGGSVFCHTNEQTKIQDTTSGLVLDEKQPTDATDCAKDDNEKYLVDEKPKDAAASPPISEMLREMTSSMKLLKTQTNCVETPNNSVSCLQHIDKEQIDPQTPEVSFTMRLDNENISYIGTPRDIFKTRSTGLKKCLVRDCLTFLNSASKEELKGLKGIGEKRAMYILELREESPFKSIEDLRELGLSTKKINAMMRGALGDF